MARWYWLLGREIFPRKRDVVLNILTKTYSIKSAAFTLAIIVFLSGCVDYRMSAREMISDMNEINSGERADINILWYKGSDAEFDYFGYVYGMTGSKNFKVPAGELLVPRMDITDDETKWVRIREITGFWSASRRYKGKWQPDESGIIIRLPKSGL